MGGLRMPSVRALGYDRLDTALPSWMTLTRGAGSWSRQTAPAVDGTTFLVTGTAQNTGRFDYSDSAGRSMLLIEPTRTNVIPASNFVDAGANDIPDGWAANAGVAATDFECAAGGPHGGIKFRLLDTAVNARGCYYDVVNADSGLLTSFSGWYRRTAAGAASVDAIHGGVAGTWATLSLGAAACDWTWFSGTADKTGGLGVDYVGLLYAATGTDPPGVVECACPQAEAGEVPTSWIPSSAAATTRAAELCAIDPSVIGRTSGLVQFLWRPDYASTAALTVDPVLFEWAPGWELMYDVSEDKLSVVVNSGTEAASSALTFARGDLLRVSVRYSSAGQQLTVTQTTGVDVATDTTSWGDPGALVPYLGSRAASVNCRPGAYGDFMSTAL